MVSSVEKSLLLVRMNTQHASTIILDSYSSIPKCDAACQCQLELALMTECTWYVLHYALSLRAQHAIIYFSYSMPSECNADDESVSSTKAKRTSELLHITRRTLYHNISTKLFICAANISSKFNVLENAACYAQILPD